MKNWPFGVGHCGCPTPIGALKTVLPFLISVTLNVLVRDPQPGVDRLQLAQRRLRHPAGRPVRADRQPHAQPHLLLDRRAVEHQHEVVGALGRLQRELRHLPAPTPSAARARSPPSRRTRSTTSCPAGSRARSSPPEPAPRPRERPRPRVLPSCRALELSRSPSARAGRPPAGPAGPSGARRPSTPPP